MRNFINTINEFFADPADREGGGDNQTIVVFDIVWDVDPEESESLPSRVSTTLHDVEEAADPFANDPDDLMDKIGNWLQNEFDPRLSNFNYQVI